MQCLPGVKSYTEVLDSFLTRLGLLKRSSIQASSVASKPPRFWYLYFAFADVTSAPEAKMCSLRISERVQLSRSKLFKLQPIVLKVKQWLRIQTNQQYKMYLYKIKYEKPIKKKKQQNPHIPWCNCGHAAAKDATADSADFVGSASSSKASVKSLRK